MPTDFLKKSCEKRSKTEKVNISILHIRNSPGTKFQLKMKILNFWTKLINRKIVFPISKGKDGKGNYHRILHIRISLGSKF